MLCLMSVVFIITPGKISTPQKPPSDATRYSDKKAWLQARFEARRVWVSEVTSTADYRGKVAGYGSTTPDYLPHISLSLPVQPSHSSESATHNHCRGASRLYPMPGVSRLVATRPRMNRRFALSRW